MSRARFNRVTAIACMAWLVAMLGTSSAQEWRKLREEGANFYDVKRSFEQAEAQALQNALLKKGADEEGFEDEAKVPGYTSFKRWEYWMEPRVYPSGNLPDPDQDFKAMQQYFQRHGALMKGAATPDAVATAIPSANWTSLGPTSWVLTSNSVAPGLGRVSAITFHPTDANTIFLGTPAGGLWKSTNGGASWSTNTDNLPVLGVSSIVIDPTNTNIMYIATGDNDGSDTKSVGVLKSTDGGATWNTTGLNFQVTESRRIYKLLMHPTNSNILVAAASNGFWKTTNAGTTWSRKGMGGYYRTTREIEFKPGDPATVYATVKSVTSPYPMDFWKSTDTGETWTQITSGVPTTANRLEIGVTPANANYVYLLVSKSADNSFGGLYRSTDSGVSFTTQSTTPNILGYLTNGSDVTAGQGSYDLAFGVSPTNADELYTGGVNIWKSTNGGVNWTNKTHWVYNTNPNAYVHADVHLFEFNGSNVYTGTDGGFFKSTDGGTTWSDLSAGMNTTEYYRIASDPNSANLVYGGAQDNTITRYSGSGIWDSFMSGDGAECLVDRTNSNIVYSATQRGSLKRSSNAGVTWSSIKNNITETGAWVTPYVMDPVSNTTLYAGYVNVWKTTSSGGSWTKLSTFANTATIVDLQVAPSDANYIYVTKTANVYRSSDGGANWTGITAGLPAAAYKQIAVASNDPQKIWLTLSGYLSGNKVWASTDGGATWTNYSGTLPNLPFNTIVYHNNGGTDALYAGADVGVYYRDNTLSDWQLYQTGLPNVPISELEIHANSGKLRAGTFGRGLWETDLVPPPGAALAFDGVNDDVTAPGFSWPTGGAITVEFWSYFASSDLQTSSSFSVGNQDTPNRCQAHAPNPSGTLHWDYGDNTANGRVSANYMPYLDKWTHVALVSEGNGGTFKGIYLDGVLVASGAVSDGPNIALSGLTVGAWPLINYRHKGKIDEFRIWNVVRGQADIQAKMNCELTGTEAGLVAYYQFNHGRAGGNNVGETTLDDLTANNNNGTLNNFALTGTTSNWVAPGGVTSGTTCGTMAMLIANAGNDNLHSGGATKLNGFASGGNGGYTYAWAVQSGPNAGSEQFSNAASPNTIFKPTAKGNYVLRLTAKDGMNATASDNVAVTVNALFAASISGDDPVNPGTTHTYTVTTDASNPSYLWIVTNGTIGGDNDQSSVEVEAGQPSGDMRVEVYVTDGVTNDVVYALKSVTVTNPNALSANAGPDRSIIVGGSATIGGSPSAIGGIPPLTYEWSPTTGLSDPNAANPLAQPITSTTYTLTVLDGFGGVATDQVDVNVTVLQVKPFVLLGNKITLARTKQHTPAGDMHSNGTLTVSKGDPSTYNSNLTAVSKITINKDNTINGNVKAPSISNSGKINGTKTIGPVANEPLPSLSYSATGSNKTVPSGGSLVLAPGSYGIVTVNSSGTLKLSSGEYFMTELRSASSNTVIEITITGGNPATINVVSNFQLGKEGEIRLLPNGEADSKLLTFNTKQTSGVSIGKEAYFLGNFNAPNAVVTLVKNSQLRGTICAKEILVERDCLFLHHDSPGTLPGPGNLPKTPGEVYEVDDENAPVASYELAQNYPNPFNPETAIRFALPEASNVTVKLYSLSGQMVRELVNGSFGIGRHQVIWDGRDASGAAVAGGIYFYRLIVHGANGDVAFTQTRKMTFVK
ncbi:hypothetical protein EDS67_11945 [candidate division KSB1 bacterium]|nr:MAG: hypothetical protein EDS67_11945 [candidate division KSB1 bacterium]MCE7942228.1 hypothetical protein [Chlorobi bacterium CHB1]MDL1876784.1 hypothetical protein [Cytophagia bacterium CHB2]